MAQIIRITSEALQATIRRLLPSQVGFGEDLQASNVITPIIDLTPTAEGSQLPYDLQTAISHGGITSFVATSGTTTVANNAGFVRIYGCCTIQGNTAAAAAALFSITDGTTSKSIWSFNQGTTTAQGEFLYETFDFTVFLRSGDSVTASCSNGGSFRGSIRQIADLNGTLTNPSGFNPQ